MKKHAQLGQWKTPPNQVYAAPSASVPASVSSHDANAAAHAASLGTKMQLMGLQKRPTPPPPSSTSMPIPAPQQYPMPIPFATSSSTTFPQPVPFQHASNGTAGSGLAPFAFGGSDNGTPTKSISTKSMLLAPNASPIAPSPFEMTDSSRTTPSPTAAKARQGRKPSIIKKNSAGSAAATNGSAPASPEDSVLSSKTAMATPEDKEKILAHSRTMARLRRQQQRVLTDSLEAEFFELCVSAAYLKAVLERTPCNVPLERTEVDRIYQEATERSFEAMYSSIPSARSQELKTQVAQGKTNMPQAHYVPSLRIDDVTAQHLAVTVGSRRESLSFSTERRKGALTWSTAGVKQLYTDLNKDALPFVCAANCAIAAPDADQNLANRLKLTPEQKERIARLVPDAKGELLRLAASQRAADLLLSESWLSLPKTDALMEHVRDTTTTEQMSKLISWSITNEAQIATLKLGSVSSGPAQ